ncbi:MAG: hypothetical protein EZS28_016550 [Streblomastix strix]|uniref:B30.2/SPRY domain-containing protein n=1 Tax=Streblomastix strix TaxID=222440 RepID=A0A5J4VZ08_9EUKA|nr:MAG: hypothetical protein EZS28_016550 [Streblomastix strix]
MNESGLTLSKTAQKLLQLLILLPFVHNYVGVEEQCLRIGLIDNLDEDWVGTVQNHVFSKSKATTLRLAGKDLMDDLSDYNVSGSLLGLGQFILLEILCEMTLPQDARQFLAVCKKIYQLLEHPRYWKIIQSKFQITPIFVIKKESQGKQQGIKFIHSNKNDYCTIAIVPVIKDGIVRFEIVLENSGSRSLGIADASCSFSAGKGPSYHGYVKKTVRYYYNGDLEHITNGTIGNRSYEDGQRISAIVDMTSNPRKVVFYVDDIEQPNFVIGIPSEIRFWAFTRIGSSSFTVTKFERLVQFIQQEVVGSKALQWGKSWK